MLGAAQVLGHDRASRGAASRALDGSRRSRACCALDQASTSGGCGDVARSGRSSRPAPRSSPRPAAALPVASASADVEAHVGLAVGGEVVERVVHRVDELVERLERLGAARARRRAPRRRARPPAARRRRRASPRAARATARSAGGGASATNVPPPRPRTACRWPLWTSAVSAWRSVERAIPSCSHSSRSAGSRVAGRAAARA